MDVGVDFNVRPLDASYFIPYGENIIAEPQITITDDYIESKILPKISLIIPSSMNFSVKKNSLQFLLAEIQNSNVIDEVIIVVYENDVDLEWYEALSFGLTNMKVVKTSGDNNRALSRNVGANEAKSDYLLFIDDDMIIKNWRVIDNVLDELIKGEYDAALFPRRHFLEFPSLYSNGNLDKLIKLWRSNPENYDIKQLFDPIKANSPYKTIKFCFPGCFMIISKTNFNLLNGFNVNYVGWGLEDADFSLRAIKRLKILNLFLKTYPMLHIDHPVSPYKSDEHRSNYGQFKSEFTSIDLDQMCNLVFTGKNINNIYTSVNLYNPLDSIQKTYSIPVSTEQIYNNYKEKIESRLTLGLTSKPEWVLLFGSRSIGSNSIFSDFDLLILFKGGMTRDYISTNNNSIKIDIEYSDIDKFNEIIHKPYAYPFNGIMELTKISNGIVLYGNVEEYNSWVDKKLNEAILGGGTIWLTTLVGMQLSHKKYGVFLKRFKKSLNELFTRAKTFPFDPNQNVLELKFALRRLLDENFVDWKNKTIMGQKIFQIQIPEQWNAINTLLE